MTDILKILTTSVRLVVTAGLILALALRFDVGRAAELIRHADLRLIAATLLVLLITNLVVGWRWQLILSGESASPGSATLLKIVFVGFFFNQVLPTGIGGDAVRAWRCSRIGIGLGDAIRSILLDRACGYLVLVALYALGLPMMLKILPDQQARSAVVAVLVLAVLGLVALVSLDRLPRPLLRLRLISEFAELSRASRRLFTDPGRCGAVVLLSVATIGLTVLAFKLIGDAVGSRLSFASWMMIVPPVTLLQLVPLSLAGWGVREAALVLALGSFGVPAEAALAVSVLVGFSLILASLPGGLIWLSNWDVAAAHRPRGVGGP
jgi:glycosyltransferase 2 family protein